MEYEKVLALFDAIPSRQPRGGLENKLRNGPVQRFLAAKKHYELEHGEPWVYPEVIVVGNFSRE